MKLQKNLIKIFYLENSEGVAKLHDIEIKYNKEIEEMQENITKLKHDTKALEDLKMKYDELLNKHDKLRNQKDHFQSLHTRALEKINELQNDFHVYKNGIVKVESNFNTSITLLNKVNLLDRIRKKYPENLEMITTDLNELKLITGKSESSKK